MFPFISILEYETQMYLPYWSVLYTCTVWPKILTRKNLFHNLLCSTLRRTLQTWTYGSQLRAFGGGQQLIKVSGHGHWTQSNTVYYVKDNRQLDMVDYIRLIFSPPDIQVFMVINILPLKLLSMFTHNMSEHGQQF